MRARYRRRSARRSCRRAPAYDATPEPTGRTRSGGRRSQAVAKRYYLAESLLPPAFASGARGTSPASRGRWNRRKGRHTTHHHHLDGYPERVRIIRRGHPLEGQALSLLGWNDRGGRFQLLVVLPDGSRTLMPARWTDLDRPAGHKPDGAAAQTPVLASTSQLLGARTIVDALLRRCEVAHNAAARSGEEESEGEAVELFRSTALQGQEGHLERTRRRTKSGGGGKIGAPDHSDGDRLTRGARGEHR